MYEWRWDARREDDIDDIGRMRVAACIQEADLGSSAGKRREYKKEMVMMK